MRIIDSTPEILKCYRKISSSKRNRIKLTDDQKSALEAIFKENPHPTTETKELLEYKHMIPLKNIQIWFQNRRAKERSIEEEKEIMENKKSRKNIVFEESNKMPIPNSFQFYDYSNEIRENNN
ncbi:homeobox domain-containing protein [Tubulinosema ratisbonensis]|uniref:Homeobox domain-containing protein n=1 Tax=Tubulinosema ratisbonensis TaxID=291195 RepID=A0A437AQL4_9MICR|nr:homeobox domain-containing protein [Tubulinosema ratisbonensis]